MRALRQACRPSGVARGFIADLTRSRAELIAENALLRQQLIVASRAVKRPAFRVHERKFGAVFDRVAAGVGTRVLHTAVRAPLMNAVCKRFLGSVRRECLDHVIILSERHLRYVLAEYALSYFNPARPHQGIGQQVPVRTERSRANFAGPVEAIPVLGGLHHDYRAAA